jgi:hypothetical protein
MCNCLIFKCAVETRRKMQIFIAKYLAVQTLSLYICAPLERKTTAGKSSSRVGWLVFRERGRGRKKDLVVRD